MHLNAIRSVFAFALTLLLSFNGVLAANGSDSNTASVQPKMAKPSVLPPKMINPIKTKTIVIKLLL